VVLDGPHGGVYGFPEVGAFREVDQVVELGFRPEVEDALGLIVGRADLPSASTRASVGRCDVTERHLPHRRPNIRVSTAENSVDGTWDDV
jgi:hypothetical protein